MITITLVKCNQSIITLEATGHSGYAPAGSDVVCAVVSAITQTLANGILEVLKLKAQVNIDETIPHLSIDLSSLTKTEIAKCQPLMQTAYLGLKQAKESYSKFIKIKEIQHD